MKSVISEERYQELADKWLRNTITAEEKKEFAQWYNSDQEKDLNMPDDFSKNEEELKDRIYSNVNRAILKTETSKNWYLSKYAAAAAVLLFLSSGLYLYLNRSQTQLLAEKYARSESFHKDSTVKKQLSQTRSAVIIKDIPPGNDKAILTLGDGSRIILDDAQNGVLANQEGKSILKTAEGELIYSFSDSDSSPATSIIPAETVSYNTIQTPKGGKFQVRLPDGSKVWLNAASSLRFPATFSGAQREVELTGEAYFEVAHDPSRIFKVTTRGQAVQVLGTHFNINAYTDEPTVNTTLLEGSVRISDLRTNKSQLLKPGEQAKLAEKIEVVNIKNTAEAVAWKDGYFQFYEADIQTVMRQIERWYDVTVRYEGEVPQNRFGGEIERNLSLLQVLKILEKSRVHFRLEGREVIVMS